MSFVSICFLGTIGARTTGGTPVPHSCALPVGCRMDYNEPASDLSKTNLFLNFAEGGPEFSGRPAASPQEALKDSSKSFLKAVYGRTRESLL
jgi:hypothetical protein